MDISKIKTESEFMDVADIWYQRSFKLRDIWMDQSQSDERRAKAYLLWVRLFNIVQKCTQIALEMSQYKLPDKVKMKDGGIRYATDYNDPAFLRGEAVIKVTPNFKS